MGLFLQCWNVCVWRLLGADVLTSPRTSGFGVGRSTSISVTGGWNCSLSTPFVFLSISYSYSYSYSYIIKRYIIKKYKATWSKLRSASGPPVEDVSLLNLLGISDRVFSVADAVAMGSPLTMPELEFNIVALDTSKAAGADGVTNAMIRHLPASGKQRLLSIYNNALLSGCVG